MRLLLDLLKVVPISALLRHYLMQVPRLLLSWTILALLVILTCAAVFSVILYRSDYVIVIKLCAVLLVLFI